MQGTQTIRMLKKLIKFSKTTKDAFKLKIV